MKIAHSIRVLAAEKRNYGGYDDSRALRNLPTRYYLQLGDYKGCLAYTRWFARTFPDDGGSPDFLFEGSVRLFKRGVLLEAQAGQTYWVKRMDWVTSGVNPSSHGLSMKDSTGPFSVSFRPVPG